MVKLLQWGFVEISKCNGVFSYLRVLLSLPFMATLTGSGGVPCQFQINIFPSHPLHILIRLPLHIPHNLIPHHALISLPLPLPRHIFPPREPLSIDIPLPLPCNLCPPRTPLSLPLALPRHLCTPCAPLSIYIPLHIPHPPCLSQRFPCCHSYLNMSQIIQCI